MCRAESGQATVELALLLPLVALLSACLVEVGSLAVDKVRLWHGAREAARIGAVEADPAAIRRAAESAGVAPIEVTVEPGSEERIQGQPLTVELIHHPSSTVPVIGMLFDGMSMTARATMRIERP